MRRAIECEVARHYIITKVTVRHQCGLRQITFDTYYCGLLRGQTFQFLAAHSRYIAPMNVYFGVEATKVILCFCFLAF